MRLPPTSLFGTKGDLWVLVRTIGIITSSMTHSESLHLAGANALGVACLKNSCLKSGAVFRADSGPGDSSPALLGVLA